MSDLNVIRKDNFTLANSDFKIPGCYVLKKIDTVNNQVFLDQIFINATLNPLIIPSGCIGQISNKELYSSISDGDIAIVSKNGNIRVILSRVANHNTVLVTERCDNLCLFCSQPPKPQDDSWLLTQASLAIAAFNSSTVIGVSGGEPLIYRDDFLTFLDFIIDHSSITQLHILTNGRAFSDSVFTKNILLRSKKIDICFGVPLYSCLPEVHDELVGAEGAFLETVRGLINAGNSGLNIELRVIPTQQNINELSAIIEFAGRVFSNISQVSIMNLEAEGFARKNWSTLYTEPSSYSEQLVKAKKMAERCSLDIILFNYPLCHLPNALHNIAVQSISDWKNYYPIECKNCNLKPNCGGFFKSSQGRYHQLPRTINYA